MKLHRCLAAATCCCLIAVRAFAQEPKCPKGLQPFANRCISQYMADYIACVEGSGGNHEEISLEISNAKSGKTTGAVSGAGSGIVAKGSGSLALDLATEEALEKKFKEKWGSSGMETCLKALRVGRPTPGNTPPKSTQPKEQSGNISLVPGRITQGPDSVLSIGQQGGITAHEVIVNPQAEPPHVTFTQEQLVPGPRKKSPSFTMGRLTGEAEKDSLKRQQYVSNPGVLVTASPDAAWGSALVAYCDHPCETIEALTKSSASQVGFIRSSENLVGVVFIIPSPLQPGMRVEWEIRSMDQTPVRIRDIEARIFQPTTAPIAPNPARD